MAENVRSGLHESTEEEVDRLDTGIRLALTLLFALIATVVESVIGIIVIFELLWTLITKQAPSPRVRELANRIIGYYYRIGRYLTYNESTVPFPFSDFPRALEGDAWDPSQRESEALGLPERDEIDDDERR
jgi:hypothetical protein